MTRWTAAVAVLAGAACASGACTPAPPPPLPLEPADFVLAGVPLDSDSVEIRMSFGAPDSVVASPNPYGGAEPLETWYYEGLVVRYSGEAAPSSYLVTGRAEATARGVRVGDPAARVLERYGEPIYRYDTIWSYTEPGGGTEPYVLEFMVIDGVVARIHVGRVDG